MMEDDFSQLYRQMYPWKILAFSNTVEGEWNTILNKFSKFQQEDLCGEIWRGML